MAPRLKTPSSITHRQAMELYAAKLLGLESGVVVRIFTHGFCGSIFSFNKVEVEDDGSLIVVAHYDTQWCEVLHLGNALSVVVQWLRDRRVEVHLVGHSQGGLVSIVAGPALDIQGSLALLDSPIYNFDARSIISHLDAIGDSLRGMEEYIADKAIKKLIILRGGGGDNTHLAAFVALLLLVVLLALIYKLGSMLEGYVKPYIPCMVTMRDQTEIHQILTTNVKTRVYLVRYGHPGCCMNTFPKALWPARMKQHVIDVSDTIHDKCYIHMMSLHSNVRELYKVIEENEWARRRPRSP